MVATANVALVAPAGTVTVRTLAARLELDVPIVTSVPPLGAGSLSVTVAVDVAPLPPAIVEGLSVRDVTVAAASAAGLRDTAEMANAKNKLVILSFVRRRSGSRMWIMGCPSVSTATRDREGGSLGAAAVRRGDGHGRIR